MYHLLVDLGLERWLDIAGDDNLKVNHRRVLADVKLGDSAPTQQPAAWRSLTDPIHAAHGQ